MGRREVAIVRKTITHFFHLDNYNILSGSAEKPQPKPPPPTPPPTLPQVYFGT